MDGQLFIISAPSGAGKTSLVRQLVERVSNLQVSISHTTRAMRPNDKDGVDYFFTDTAKFEEMIAAGQFLEHAEVFGNYYGTSVAAVQNSLANGIDILLEIDWQGAKQVAEKIPEARSIFVLPPSKEALKQRLKGRASDSDEVIARRTSEAVEEMRHYGDANYLVINDSFDVAIGELVALIESSRLIMARQTALHRHLINSLIEN